MEDNNEMNADCWVPAEPNVDQTGYQIGYLEGYLGRQPGTDEVNYMKGYVDGVKDANRDRSRG